MNTKLHLSCLLTVLLLSGTLVAQDIRERLDVGNGARFHDILRLPGGEMIGVGELEGTPIPMGWVTLMTADGEILWSLSSADLSHASRFQRIIADSDTTFVVGGTQYVDNLNGYDLLAFRMDRKGNVRWSRRVDVGKDDQFRDLSLNPKGILLLGNVTDPSSGKDIILAQLDIKGHLTLSRRFGAAGIEIPAVVRQGSASAIYIGGTTTSYTSPGSPPNAFLLQVTPAFSLSWIRVIGDDTGHSVQAMDIDADGHPVLALHDDGGGLNANVLARFDPAGDLEWARSYSTGMVRAMVRGTGGKLHVADDHVVFAIDKGGNPANPWTVQLEPDFEASGLQIGDQGQVLLSGWRTGPQNEPAIHVIHDLFASTCSVYAGDLSFQDQSPKVINQLINEQDDGVLDSFFLDLKNEPVVRMIDCLSTSTDGAGVSASELSTFPNPTGGPVWVRLPMDRAGQLTWYSSDGAIRKSMAIPEGTPVVEATMDAWPSGVYLLEFRSGDRQWTRQVIRTP